MIRKRLPELLILAACLVAGLLMLAFLPQPAGAQRPPSGGVAACPATMPGGSTELACACPATGGDAPVWGTDYYTDDSSLCRAAVHAGAIGANGGTIRARAMPGRDYYTGSRRNGIASEDYGSWSRTIVFEGTEAFAGDAGGMPLCPGTYQDNGTGWSGSCRCPDAGDGAVWGANPYTTDSNLCRAARHAGAIGAAGGVVQVSPAAGRASYPGTTRNGVTTSSWGSYGTSFRVSAASAR